ncbi:MAG TPA: TlpA disulfide reductase family protein, partial [Robiginitalea sp.]|nr:TlpA disulfide reductase family protein [Robiginitalea sp.]
KWATWCAPCVAEMPNIHRLYLESKDDVRFLMVTWDSDFEKAKRFKAKHAYTFPIYQVYGFLPEDLKTPSIPATFIIRTTKGEMYRYMGMRDYDTPEFKEFLQSLGSP